MVQPDRIALHLQPSELTSIAEWCRRRGVAFEMWPRQPACFGWRDLAVGRAVDSMLRTRRARSGDRALELVAREFGLGLAGLRRRDQRARAKNCDKLSQTDPRPRAKVRA